MTWAWSPARSLGLVLGGGVCVWALCGYWSGAWAVALGWAWLGTSLVCPGWCLRWLASARPLGHWKAYPSTRQIWKSSFLRVQQQLRPTRFPYFPSESLKKGSFWRHREGIRPRYIPNFPDTCDFQPCCKRVTERILLEASRVLVTTRFASL